jgi:DNA-3-methyladenine glycosylase II
MKLVKNMMEQAAKHLMEHDPVMAPVVELAGLCTIRPHKDYYGELVDGIIGQQLSVKAAAKILDRFKGLFGGKLPSPEEILMTAHETLRGVGLSNAKAKYVKDLASHILDGKLKLPSLDNMSNEEIIKELTAVKGIGEWTAHMFMMFAMARPDILATGDLGIKMGVKQLYGLDHLPSPEEIKQIAISNNWRPYESIACWYIWRAKDMSLGV